MRVVIAGGGNVGPFIANDLRTAGHDVLAHRAGPDVVGSPRPGPEGEPGHRVARRPTPARSPSLRGGGLGTCDVVVAATGDDEDNLVDLAAGQAGVRRAPGRRPGQPPEERVAVQRDVGRRRGGVDPAPASPALVEEAVIGRAASSACSSSSGAGPGWSRSPSPTTRRSSASAIRELDIPRDATFVAVVRDEHVVVPRGRHACFQAGDEVHGPGHAGLRGRDPENADRANDRFRGPPPTPGRAREAARRPGCT